MPISNTGNPYVGPRSIQAGEAFYGRDREIRSLSSLLIAERIVLLHSPSGAGKSSLIQAGISPRLSERFNVLPVIRVNQDFPIESQQSLFINRYLLSTLLSLEKKFPGDQQIPQEQLVALSLDEYLKKRHQQEASPNCLLFFDQFEEVLTASPTDQSAKQNFFKHLGDALQEPTRWALFSIREDYMGGLAPYVREIPNRLNVTFRLDLLAPDAARQAIQNPAKTNGGDFTDSAAGALVNDLRKIKVQQPDGSFNTEDGPSVEPVQLQVICYNLWESKSKNTQLVITDDDLKKMGNVDQALANYYTSSILKICQDANLEERVVRNWFDKYLITSEGIRSQVLRGVDKTEGLPNKALSMLEDNHLIRTETRAGKTWYELSHDRLVEPIRKNNFSWYEQNLSLFQRQSETWMERGQPDDLLLRGKELEQANQEAQDITLTEIERKYLDACQRQAVQEQRRLRQNRRLRFLAVGATILLLLASLLGWIAQQENTRYQREAGIIATNLVTSTKLVATNAVLATEGAQNAAAAATNQQAAQENAQKAEQKQIEAQATASWAANARVEQLYSQALSSIQDPSQYRLSLLLGVEAHKILKEYGQLDTKPELLSSLLEKESPDLPYLLGDETPKEVLFSPDGAMLAIAGNNHITFWDVSDPTQAIQRKVLETGPVSTMMFSANGRLIAVADAKSLAVWNLETWQKVADITEIRKPQGDPLKIPNFGHQSFAFSPDGKRLAFINGYNLEFLDITTNGFEYVKTADKLHGVIMNMWNDFDYDYIDVIAYCPPPADKPGRQILVSYGEDGQMRVWSASDIRQSLGLLAQTPINETVKQIEFSRDGEVMVLVTESGNLWLYDFRKPEEPYRTIIIPAAASHVTFSGDRSSLFVLKTDGKISVWNIKDLNNPVSIKTLEYSNQSSEAGITAHPSQDIIIAGNNGSSVLWDLRHISALWHSSISGTNQITATAYSPARNLLVEIEFANTRDKSTLFLWDITKPNLPYLAASTLLEDRNSIEKAVFSPDGSFLGIMDSAGRVTLLDIQGKTPKQLGYLDAYTKNSFLILTNDAILFSQKSLGDIWSFQQATAWQHHPLPPLDASISPCKNFSTAVYHPSTNRLAIAGCDTITLWDIKDSSQTRLLYTFPDQQDTKTLVFSEDGSWLARGSGNDRIQIWDIADTATSHVIVDQSISDIDISNMAVDKTSSTIFTVNSNGQVMVWGFNGNGTLSRKFLFASEQTKKAMPHSISLSSDGVTLISASKTEIILWSVNTSDWLDKTCRVINHTVFTKDEWKRFFEYEDEDSENRLLTCEP